jgi:hypothetical protein
MRKNKMTLAEYLWERYSEQTAHIDLDLYPKHFQEWLDDYKKDEFHLQQKESSFVSPK